MSIEFNRTYHSPINNSSSKQLYSFSKASRFQPTVRSECKNSFYDTKRGAFQKRSTSFGLGNKVSFANTEGVPHGGAYNKNSDFSVNIIKKRGYSFGKNENRSLIDNPQEQRKFPGPGSYLSINEKFKSGFGESFHNISFTMRGKYEDPLEKHGNQLGPGQYQTHGNISQRGNYFNSKYAGSKSPIMSKNNRFQLEKNQSPGPGHYKGQEKINLNGTGTYFNSKFSTTKAGSFGHSKRPSPAKPNEAPDPGAYSPFSEFGLKVNNWK